LSCSFAAVTWTKTRDQETNSPQGAREEVALGGVNLISRDLLVIVLAFEQDRLGSEISA
jgi:hypothetical protein